MATPALRAIASLPNLDELILIGRPGPLSLLENAPYANRTIAFKPRSKASSALGRRALAMELRRRKLDTILLLPNSLSSACIAIIAGIPRRVGFARDGRSWLLTDRIPLHSRKNKNVTADSLHILSQENNWREAAAIDYYLRLARQLGCDTDDRTMEMFVSDQDKRSAQLLLKQLGFSSNERLVVINNSSATALSRLWPKQYAVDACLSLAKSGVQVLIHAGPDDRRDANQMADAVSHRNVQSMGQASELPLGLSRGILSMADVVVSTDSGVRHIAVSLNRNVVSLFGPTQSKLTKTYNRPEIQLENSLDCRPCLKDACPLKHHRCMSEISTDRVLQAVRVALARPKLQAA
ncbi:MAG: glycosyltransferase family 9 protein [Pirellula sp.]|nr:glycosyltransferase family 9 protein [Pirellula sp.]